MGRLEGGGIDAKPVLDVDPHILNQHIRARHQAQEGCVSCRLLQVEGDAALVAVEIGEIRPIARATEAIVLTGRFNPDHARAPIGQVTDTGRASPGKCQIQNADSVERQP